ncbi:hypothetical protein IF650_18565 [Cellulosimicrobium terreum]|nr:hypothetical protein [Cellulosimicrobium terreum]
MSAPAAPRVRTDPDEQLTGREVRGLTARVTAAHAGRGVGQVVTDVAYVVVSVALATGIVVGVVSAVGDAVGATDAWTVGDVAGAWTGGGDPVAPGVLHALVGLVVLALLASAAARLGPAGVGTAGLHWWVPAPVDRRGLLVPSVRSGTVVGVLVGAVGLALGGLVAGAGTTTVLLGALVGAPAGVLVVAGAGLAQPSPGRSRVLRGAADAAVALVPVLGVLGVASGVDLPVLSASPVLVVVLAGVLAAGAVALVTTWVSRVDRLGLAALAGRSGTVDRLGAAVLSADTRDLGRALDVGTALRRPRRLRHFALVRGPRAAVVAADAVLLARSPSSLAQLVGLVALLALAHQVPVLAAGPGLAAVVLAAGARGARLGAGGAVAADMVPALDASLPLSARGVRLVRAVVPGAVAALCLALGLVPVAVATSDSSWVVLGALVGVGCGAAAVRGALRPQADWSGPLLATPAGAFPVNVAAVARQGPDLVLLSALPFAVAAVLGVVTPAVVLAQAVVAVVALAVAAHAPRPR